MLNYISQDSTLFKLHNGLLKLDKSKYPINDKDIEDCSLPDILPDIDESYIQSNFLKPKIIYSSKEKLPPNYQAITAVNIDSTLNNDEYVYNRPIQQQQSYRCNRCNIVPIIENEKLICPGCRVILCENYGIRGLSWKSLSIGTYSEDTYNDYSLYNIPAGDDVAKLEKLVDHDVSSSSNYRNDNTENEKLIKSFSPIKDKKLTLSSPSTPTSTIPSITPSTTSSTTPSTPLHQIVNISTDSCQKINSEKKLDKLIKNSIETEIEKSIPQSDDINSTVKNKSNDSDKDILSDNDLNDKLKNYKTKIKNINEPIFRFERVYKKPRFEFHKQTQEDEDQINNINENDFVKQFMQFNRAIYDNSSDEENEQLKAIRKISDSLSY